MPLGQGIEDMWEAVRGRIELSGHDPSWEVTAGSFEDALEYARSRFGDPVVLSRRDRSRWWPRVTLSITTDPALAGAAPPLADLATPAVPAQTTATSAADAQATPVERSGRRANRHRHSSPEPTGAELPQAAPPPAEADRAGLPASLEAIFAHQEQRHSARHRAPGASPGGDDER